MKKKVLVLTGDYWHPTDSITPVLGSIFDESKWDMIVTENPKELSADEKANFIVK